MVEKGGTTSLGKLYWIGKKNHQKTKKTQQSKVSKKKEKKEKMNNIVN